MTKFFFNKKNRPSSSLRTFLIPVFFVSVEFFFRGEFVRAEGTISSKFRIQSVLFDKGEPHRIFLTPGLGTVLWFPCFVSDGFVGDESQVTVRFSPSTKKSLLLSLKSSASHATNLIVRCENQATHFVFDIVPNRQRHQDVLEIRSSFGRPTFQTETGPSRPEEEKDRVREKEGNQTQGFGSDIKPSTSFQKPSGGAQHRVVLAAPKLLSESGSSSRAVSESRAASDKISKSLPSKKELK